LPGNYHIYTNYYANHKQSLAGGTTLLLQLFTNFARPKLEKSQKIAIRLQSSQNNITVGDVNFEPSDPKRIDELNEWLGKKTETSSSSTTEDKEKKGGFFSKLFK
jgi:hypothetical protein